MKKQYVSPKAEYIKLSAKEALAFDEVEGEETIFSGEEGWD